MVLHVETHPLPWQDMLCMCLKGCAEHTCAFQRLRNLGICIDTHAACTLARTSASDTMCLFFSFALECEQPTWILVHKRQAMRCNAVCLALAFALLLSHSTAATSIKPPVLLGWEHEVARKTGHIHTCVYTRIHSANRHVRRCLEVCVSPASAPRLVHIMAAPSMKRFVPSRCPQRRKPNKIHR